MGLGLGLLELEPELEIEVSRKGKMSIAILQEQGIPRERFEEILRGKGIEESIVWCADGVEAPVDTVALVTVNRPVDESIIKPLVHLKSVAVAFTGYDVIEKGALKSRGVTLYNVPDYSTSSVAELAIGLTISVLREIPRGDSAIRNGLPWAISSGGSDLRGKTVGIVGTGTIGIATARLFVAFGCKIIGWSRSERDAFKEIGGTYVSRQELFSVADIVSIHIPNNVNTRGMIGEKDLSLLRSSSILINTARGPVIDQPALAQKLRAGRFRAGLDVFATEPIPSSDSIREISDKNVLTPHVAYKTVEALERRAEITSLNLARALGTVTDNKELNMIPL